MKTIYVVGGDGFARECAAYILELSTDGGEISFGGFLGHNGYHVDFKSMEKWFKGDVSQHVFTEDEYAVIGAGFPNLRRKIYDDLKSKRVPLYNLVAKGCVLHDSIQIGEGNFFAPPFRGSVDMVIGNGNVFNGGVVTGHDDIIGNFNFFGPFSQILGNVTIGSNNVIGANAVLLPHAKIGDNNKVSPASVIYKGCRNNCYMHGNPAIKTGIVE